MNVFKAVGFIIAAFAVVSLVMAFKTADATVQHEHRWGEWHSDDGTEYSVWMHDADANTLSVVCMEGMAFGILLSPTDIFTNLTDEQSVSIDIRPNPTGIHWKRWTYYQDGNYFLMFLSGSKQYDKVIRNLLTPSHVSISAIGEDDVDMVFEANPSADVDIAIDTSLTKCQMSNPDYVPPGMSYSGNGSPSYNAYRNRTAEHGASRSSGGTGDTPIHTAIRNNNIKAARRMIASSHQHELCRRGAFGHTPWELASILDANEIQLMLISARASYECGE